jgi:hypothetical protein
MLEQNFPNPFNPSTLGQQVAELVNHEKEPGNHVINFDGTNLSSGIYFYCLQSNGRVETRTCVLLK